MKSLKEDLEFYNVCYIRKESILTKDNFGDIVDDCKLIFKGIMREGGHEEHQTGFASEDEYFAIFSYKGRWGHVHYFPDGYSSYTFEPQITINIYMDYSFEQFFRLGLTQEMRELAANLNPKVFSLLYDEAR